MNNQRIKKAKRFLKDAEILFQNGGFDSCITRCYYAVYHALVALLEKAGVKSETWPHDFVLSESGRLFVHRKKVLPQEFLTMAYKLREHRHEADYRLEEKSEKVAKRQLDKTKTLCYNVFQEIKHEKANTA